MSALFLQLLLGTVFLSVVYLHVAKKNLGAITAYGIQSAAIILVLGNSYFETGSLSLLLVTLLILIVKVILAPIFFTRLIKKHELKFSVSTYLNTPITLVILAGLTAIAHSEKFTPLTSIVPAHHTLLALALSTMFLSLFLIVNRKGALSQIIGVLSFENSIVAFAIFAGLEQSPSLQIGIIFDIFAWLIIATVFVSMIYEHFGSLDVTSMKNLKH
jgi:hydrogenase-4 component E